MALELVNGRSTGSLVVRVVAWGCLGALLAAELLAYTLHFHTGALLPDADWWAQFLRAMPYVLRFGMAAFAATLLLGHADLWDELRTCGYHEGRVYRRGAFLAGHLAALGVFLWLSGVVLSGDLAGSSRFPSGWAAVWTLAGATALACGV